MKRIGFAGASGTGKTWLAEQIARELNLPLCPVGSRQVAQQMGFANPYDVDHVAGARAAFQTRLQQAKTEWERHHPSFVSDRTPIDNLTYMALHSVQAIDDAMWKLTAQHFNTYTHVIICFREGFHRLGNDPARVPHLPYHATYEACLIGLLESFVFEEGSRIRLLCLRVSDAAQRLALVSEFVNAP